MQCKIPASQKNFYLIPWSCCGGISLAFCFLLFLPELCTPHCYSSLSWANVPWIFSLREPAPSWPVWDCDGVRRGRMSWFDRDCVNCVMFTRRESQQPWAGGKEKRARILTIAGLGWKGSTFLWRLLGWKPGKMDLLSLVNHSVLFFLEITPHSGMHC